MSLNLKVMLSTANQIQNPIIIRVFSWPSNQIYLTLTPFLWVSRHWHSSIRDIHWWHKFQYCCQHFIIWEENSKVKQMHLPLLFHHFEENVAVHEQYSVIQIQLNRWGRHTQLTCSGWGADRSLLALHLVWAELGSLSPLPHSHTNLGLVLQPIIYPGKHSKPAQAHKNLFLAQKS